jgi:hypothetical protein
LVSANRADITPAALRLVRLRPKADFLRGQRYLEPVIAVKLGLTSRVQLVAYAYENGLMR